MTAFGYIALQFVASFIFMLFPNMTSNIPIIIQTIFLAIFLFLSAGAMLAVGILKNVDRKEQEQTLFIKTIASDIERLIPRVEDKETRKKLEELFETARYSDLMKHERLTEIDGKIWKKTVELVSLVSSGDDIAPLCKEITLLLGDRNTKCKELK
jgi:hypothetical protein